MGIQGEVNRVQVFFDSENIANFMRVPILEVPRDRLEDNPPRRYTANNIIRVEDLNYEFMIQTRYQMLPVEQRNHIFAQGNVNIIVQFLCLEGFPIQRNSVSGRRIQQQVRLDNPL